jgi:hypothetical protein
MLSGHPNFLSDVKSTAGGLAFLFPAHPMASTWSDEYEKFVCLNTRYHTRPEVEAWAAHGGRWTENLGTYVWAFLRPALHANFLLSQSDGHNRIPTPQIAQLAEWLVNALSAPFAGENAEFLAQATSLHDAHQWGIVTAKDGLRRVHPPMGAHAERRKPPRGLWYLGTTLQRYAPLTAEHAMWASHPDDQELELPREAPDPWQVIYRQQDNRGTNPHLRSSKFTGYGITLRAKVGTPEELSVHLQQIDDGPNYRWGVPAEGGCGVLYFYAGGKGYSHNGKEDEGDRFNQDTDFGTNFGVWKDGRFRSVGQNVLSRPMYDLGTVQLAELVPRTGNASYCTPEYVSRSLMLAGADYFILYDRVFNESVGHRLSWFNRRGDPFPFITLLRGTRRETFNATSIETAETTGKWYDGTGDSMVCVTHREGIVATATPFGAKITTPEAEDWVFFEPSGTHFDEAGLIFDGTSGLIRKRGKTWEATLFHGTRIGLAGIILRVSQPELAISLHVDADGSVRGKFVAGLPVSIELEMLASNAGRGFYVDGRAVSARAEGNLVRVSLPAGSYQWEFSVGSPVPPAPRILRTEDTADGGRVLGEAVGGATRYRLELSPDNGATWKPHANGPSPALMASGLAKGSKAHVRLVAINEKHESEPGPEYPLYVTGDPPLAPDGLAVDLAEGQAMLSWGEVLGVTEYRLYARKSGASSFVVLYRGLDRSFLHHDQFLHAADPAPATRAVLSLVEYAVSAVNGNGEGKRSRSSTSDPASWRNWNPPRNAPGSEPFRRPSVVGRFGEPLNDDTGPYYPR